MPWIALIFSIVAGVVFWKSTNDVREAMLIWLASLVLGTFPVWFGMIDALRVGGTVSLNMLGNGNLMMTSATVCANAAGKMFLCKAKNRLLTGASGFLCVIFVLLGGSFFMSITKEAKKDSASLTRNGALSLSVFLFTAALSGTCVVCAERAKKDAEASQEGNL